MSEGSPDLDDSDSAIASMTMRMLAWNCTGYINEFGTDYTGPCARVDPAQCVQDRWFGTRYVYCWCLCHKKVGFNVPNE